LINRQLSIQFKNISSLRRYGEVEKEGGVGCLSHQTLDWLPCEEMAARSHQLYQLSIPRAHQPCVLEIKGMAADPDPYWKYKSGSRR
jgi:hypothetical protein